MSIAIIVIAFKEAGRRESNSFLQTKKILAEGVLEKLLERDYLAQKLYVYNES